MTATRDLTACPRSCVKRLSQEVLTTGRWIGAGRALPLGSPLKASRGPVMGTRLVLATIANPGVSSAPTPATQPDTTKTRLRLMHPTLPVSGCSWTVQEGLFHSTVCLSLCHLFISLKLLSVSRYILAFGCGMSLLLLFVRCKWLNWMGYEGPFSLLFFLNLLCVFFF